MAKRKTQLRTDLGWSTHDSVTVRGFDLPRDLIGKVNLGDMAFLEIMGRLPRPEESIVFNAIVVTLVEHGVTPSALATRLTYLGAPESLQGAVAAGLLGLGTVFVGPVEGTAKMLQAVAIESVDLEKTSSEIVASYLAKKEIVPGLGHPIHKPIDPRTVRLFELARANGFDRGYIRLLERIQVDAEAAYGRVLPINAAGAIGAIASELGLDWRVCRGIGVMARAIGLVGHILEEIRDPMAQEIWFRIEEEATSHARPAGEKK